MQGPTSDGERESAGAKPPVICPPAHARTTRVPAHRSCRPRRSRPNSAVKKPRPAGTARAAHTSVLTSERPKSSDCVGTRGNDLDTGGHLAECLTAGGERDQISAILHQQKREQGRSGQDVQLPSRETADLGGEVDDRGINRRENDQIDRGRRQASRQCSRLRLDAGAGREGRLSVAGIRGQRPGTGILGCSARSFDTSGVARRTASGVRGGDGFVMSGTSSSIGSPNRGNACRAPDREVDAVAGVTGSGSGVSAVYGGRGSLRQGERTGVRKRQVIERLSVVGFVAAYGQIGKVQRRTQREIISAIAAALDVLEPQVTALGTLHGSGRAARSLPSSASPGAGRGLRGRRRQSNELSLNVGTEAIGIPFLSVGRPHPIQRRQGITQMPSAGKRPRPRESGLAAQRDRETGVNGGRGHGGRWRRARLECEQRPPVDWISRRHQRATGQTHGDEHQCEHETRPARPRPIARPGRERRSSGARRGDGTLSRRALLEPVQPVENGPRLVGGAP